MILVTGSNGQLGRSFQILSGRFPEREWAFTDAGSLDITDARAVHAFFSKHKPAYCLNCAAYTAVDLAETNKQSARKVNVRGVINLAEACRIHQTQLIHFSTDYVYHSRQNTPFRETDPTRPKSVYARTKLAGEKAALRLLPGAMIIRTSWVYAPFGKNFVGAMLRLGGERAQLGVVFDQIGSPTYAPDLAAAVLQILDQAEPGQLGGIWHYANEGVCSWYDFAVAIFELSGTPCAVLPIETSDYPTPASRPPFSLLNKGKIKESFGIQIPYWRESLVRCLQEMGRIKNA